MCRCIPNCFLLPAVTVALHQDLLCWYISKKLYSLFGEMLWHCTSTSVHPPKPLQICLHFHLCLFTSKEAKAKGKKTKNSLYFPQRCNASLKQQRKTSKPVKFGKWNGRVLSLPPLFSLCILFYIYISGVTKMLLSGEIYTSKQRKGFNLHMTDMTRMSKKCKARFF